MKSKLLGEVVDDCTRLIGEGGLIVCNEDDYFQTQHFDLDTALGGGFEKTKVYLLKGRKGNGKTSFAVDLVCGLGTRGYKTAYFTLEDDLEKTGQKILAHVSGVPYQKVRAGLMSDEEYSLINASAGIIGKRNITLVWETQDITDIVNEACLLKVETGLDVIIIDSLEQISHKGKSIRRVLKSFKNIAEQLNVAVIVTSGSSGSASRDDKALTVREVSGPLLQSVDPDNYLTGNDIDYLLYLEKGSCDEAVEKIRYCSNLYVFEKGRARPVEVNLQFIPRLIWYGNIGYN